MYPFSIVLDGTACCQDRFIDACRYISIELWHSLHVDCDLAGFHENVCDANIMKQWSSVKFPSGGQGSSNKTKEDYFQQTMPSRNVIPEINSQVLKQNLIEEKPWSS